MKYHSITAAGLSEHDFRRLAALIKEKCGIKIPPQKKVMLEARLQKRLRILGISSFRDYCERLLGADTEDDEIVQMIDAVTTNKTEFFREPLHFEYLRTTVLPAYLAYAGQYSRPFAVWSAGCSTGEEPYSIAMVLSEFSLEHPGFGFSVLATDISTRVLEKARLGIYHESESVAVPAGLKQRYFMRSKDRKKALLRIVPELRALVKFNRLNLTDLDTPLKEPLDAIFCRNVLIYFDRITQERVLRQLCMSLKPGGRLFLGHAETVHGLELPLEREVSTVYRRLP